MKKKHHKKKHHEFLKEDTTTSTNMSFGNANEHATNAAHELEHVQSHGKLLIACVDHLLESLRVERVNLEAVKHSFEAQKVAFQAEKESFEAAQAEQAKQMEQAVGKK